MEASPKIYRLLVGPYRLALWAILCRFKTRLVEQLTDKVDAIDSVKLRQQIAADLAEAREVFVTKRKAAAQRILAEKIQRLIEAGYVPEKEMQARFGTRASPAWLAERRMHQVEVYFDHIVDTWWQLGREQKVGRLDVFAAISGLVWNYYAIVYRGRGGKGGARYFATWMPPADLFNVPMISRRGALDGRNGLVLYPAWVTETQGNDGEEALRFLLDCTSEAMLDFEAPDPLLGVIQALKSFRNDQPFVRRDWMAAALSEEGPGAFTDIFHFINDGFRYFLTGDEVGLVGARSARDQEPLGILFIVTASVSALLRLADPERAEPGCLQALCNSSWRSVGGTAFTDLFNRDLSDLLGIHVPTMRNRDRQSERLRAYEGFGHALKNIMEVTGWEESQRQLLMMRRYGDRLPREETAHGVEATARTLAMFGMIRGLGEFVRIENAAERLDWKKFNSWIDDSELQRWQAKDAQYVGEKYALSAFAVAQSVCFGMGWKRLSVLCREAGVQLAYDESRLEPLRREDLLFPPFGRGSDVVYAYFFALAEPLTNAIRGLFDYRSNLPEDSEVRIEVQPDLKADAVMLKVINPSTFQVNPTLSGLDNTRGMLGGLKFINIRAPETRALGPPGLFEVSVTIQVNPLNLVPRARDGSR